MTALTPRSGGVYLDCTFGRGGHALALLGRVGPEGRVIGIDRDPEAVAAGRAMAERDPRLTVHHSSFSRLNAVAKAEGVEGRVDGILFDLGVSSPQLDALERGFSFLKDGPLDMRMDPSNGPSAADWLSRAPEEEIAQVLKEYGEERYARRIARAIVRARGTRPLLRTGQLAEIVNGASPTRERDKHPATRTFQAIRIYVNREIEEIEAALERVIELLAPGGRLAVLSFHSLEDRIVKRFMRSHARGDEYPRDLPVPQSAMRPRLKVIGKPVRPSLSEVAQNPRARSAVLRVAEKLA
jgi:16S rRNA (cytosine1402-N4)-methyltransferase